ncbi:preprotein translocase subunit SecA [Parcubacteria bacterium SG8_24]|nr:MAG: preprotein translocase subunit SecA [Parcubacteria bacterium SG8_24]
MSLLTKIFGDPNERVLDSLEPLLADVNELEAKTERLSPPALREASLALRERVRGGEDLDAVLTEAFALCREAAKRTLGQRHYDVQIKGGIVLHRGQIAEMRTGEGKTLTATLAVYLNALAGQGVHVITVNDYLARRDMVWMGQVYHALGITVGCINHQSAYVYDPEWRPAPEAEELSGDDLEAAAAREEGGASDRRRDETGSFLVQEDFLRPVTRREAYQVDVTYGTNNEYGFDYLRDNMVMRPEQRVQRELHYAIIDEVDSILIDEARTPLIISAPAEEAAEMYYRFADLVKDLKENEDYNIDEKMRAAALTEAGIFRIERMLGVENIYAEGGVRTVHHIEQALRAHAVYKRDRDYVVKDGEVIIVDEFTGRLMHGRRYSEGLHQAIEAKEGVEIQRESQTLATVTFQNYFRLYDKLAGMTGTAVTEAEEFAKIYGLEVVVAPTNKPSQRTDLQDRVYKSEEAKFQAVVREIKERHERGQPILVGTVSIEKNEILGELLRREGIPHELLNAKNHEREAQIIAQAGRLGAVTVATNMAGRGVDIVLGGNPPDSREAERIKELGGLMVLGTERHESRRIDNQLRGRSGRQGDPGTTQFFVSLEDDLMRIFGGERMKGFMDRVKLPDDIPIENKMVSKSIESAQSKVEGHHFDVRKHLLEYDDVLNKHREAVYRKRAEILATSPEDREGIRQRALEMVEGEIEQVVLFHTSAEDEATWNLQEIAEVARTIFPVPEGMPQELGDLRGQAGSKVEDAKARTGIIEYLTERAQREYDALESKVNEAMNGPQAFAGIVKGMMLRAIDMLWVEHLDAMEHLRTGIGLRGYGQRDPLIEYKRESFRMFNELLATINKQVVYSLYKIGAVQRGAQSLMERQGVRLSAPVKAAGAGASAAAASDGGKKVGRNDPCPCGSGKKYKKCCGA